MFRSCLSFGLSNYSWTATLWWGCGSIVWQSFSLQTFAPKLVILDFSDMDSMEEVVAEVMECYGCVDVLICNSSMKLKAPARSVSLELDRNIMDINYFGPCTLAKGGCSFSKWPPQKYGSSLTHLIWAFVYPKYATGVLPAMISRRSGHIILVNSIQGRVSIPFRSSCESCFWQLFTGEWKLWGPK